MQLLAPTTEAPIGIMVRCALGHFRPQLSLKPLGLVRLTSCVFRGGGRSGGSEASPRPPVAGYHAHRPLGEQAATQLPFFLQARGCQLIARWALRHESDLTLTLHRLDAMAALGERIRDFVQIALA